MNVVVVDDSKTVLMTITALLENLGVDEKSIFTFTDATKALTFIEENGVDIIFSDIQMPGMDGFEFVTRLLDLSTKYVSTLFIVSADEHLNNVARMKDIGGKRFIKKPINAKHFDHFVALELKKLRKKFNVFHETKVFQDEEEKTTDSEMTRSYDFTNITEADYPTIAMQIGIRPKYIPILLKSFFSEASINLTNLEDAVAIKDYAAIERYGHSIKGSAGNMKFNTVYEIFKSLEEAARLNDESFDYAKMLLPFREWITNDNNLHNL